MTAQRPLPADPGPLEPVAARAADVLPSELRGIGAELWLLRHAEVHEDWRGKAYGDLDVPLSRAGLQRTEEFARSLSRIAPDLVLSSPLERALELGRTLARSASAPLEVHPELREIHRGDWQGMSVEDLHGKEGAAVRSFYADPWNWKGHGGESDEDLSARIWPVVDEVRRARPGARIAITTHYNVIRVLLATALGIPAARSFAVRIDPAHAACLVDSDTGWVLRHSNVEACPEAQGGMR